MDKHVYVDMDHDGAREIIGVYADERGVYHTWYCGAGRGGIYESAVSFVNDYEIEAKLVHVNGESMDDVFIELLEHGSETHVAINACRWVGTSKNYTILALRGGDIECVLSNQYGYVSMNYRGDITLNVEAYDGMYDAAIDAYILHTWKDTYLYYDDNTYNEYGARLIAEAEFLGFGNAAGVMSQITAEQEKADVAGVSYAYYVRSNGIAHIQCEAFLNSGDIVYGYYTVRYADGIITADAPVFYEGQMAPYFSSLHVTY